MRRPQNLKKNYVLRKQLFLLSSVKTSGRFFQIFVAFSEMLNFTLLPPLSTTPLPPPIFSFLPPALMSGSKCSKPFFYIILHNAELTLATNASM